MILVIVVLVVNFFSGQVEEIFVVLAKEFLSRKIRHTIEGFCESRAREIFVAKIVISGVSLTNDIFQII